VISEKQGIESNLYPYTAERIGFPHDLKLIEEQHFS
jgi:hypothetical protein